MEPISASEFPKEPHYRLCLRINNPDYVGRSQIKKCIKCNSNVWYDPKASLWPPGEIIICEICFEKVI